MTDVKGLVLTSYTRVLLKKGFGEGSDSYVCVGDFIIVKTRRRYSLPLTLYVTNPSTGRDRKTSDEGVVGTGLSRCRRPDSGLSPGTRHRDISSEVLLTKDPVRESFISRLSVGTNFLRLENPSCPVCVCLSHLDFR